MASFFANSFFLKLVGDDTNLYDPFTNNESLSPAATKISHQQALDAIVRAAKNGDSSGVEEAAKLLNKSNCFNQVLNII